MSDIQFAQGGTETETTSPDVARDIYVIPAFNEALLIGRCIRSVLDAGVPPQHVFVIAPRNRDVDTPRDVRGTQWLEHFVQDVRFGSSARKRSRSTPWRRC
jgi:hypothetical protein